MLLVNLSTDSVILQTPDGETTVDYGRLERDLPEELSAQVNRGEQQFTVINGPGGFTTLRIGCLTLNMLQMLQAGELQFFDCSKISLYQRLYEQDVLPRYGLIYIGQQKNVWLYDFAEERLQKQKLASLPEQLGDDHFGDQVTAHDLQAYCAEGQMVSLQAVTQGVKVTYQGEETVVTHNDLDLTPIDYLQPNYMMSPTIGPTKDQ